MSLKASENAEKKSSEQKLASQSETDAVMAVPSTSATGSNGSVKKENEDATTSSMLDTVAYTFSMPPSSSSALASSARSERFQPSSDSSSLMATLPYPMPPSSSSSFFMPPPPPRNPQRLLREEKQVSRQQLQPQAHMQQPREPVRSLIANRSRWTTAKKFSATYSALLAEIKENKVTQLDASRSALGQYYSVTASHDPFVTTDDDISAVTVSTDQKMLVCGEDNGEIQLFSLPDRQLIQTLKGHKEGNPISSVQLLSNGDLVSTGTAEDSTIRIWKRAPRPQQNDQPAEYNCVQILQGHTGGVQCMQVLPNGEDFVSGGADDYTMRIWHRDSPDNEFKCAQVLEGHNFDVRSLITESNNTIWSAGWDGRIIKWQKGLDHQYKGERFWQQQVVNEVNNEEGVDAAQINCCIRCSGFVVYGSQDGSIWRTWTINDHGHQKQVAQRLNDESKIESIDALEDLGNGTFLSFPLPQKKLIRSLYALDNGTFVSFTLKNMRIYDVNAPQQSCCLYEHQLDEKEGVYGSSITKFGNIWLVAKGKTFIPHRFTTCSLSAEQIKAILTSLKESNTSVTTLDLSGQAKMDDTLIDTLIAALTAHPTLKTVILEKTGLSSDGMSRLKAAVQALQVTILEQKPNAQPAELKREQPQHRGKRKPEEGESEQKVKDQKLERQPPPPAAEKKESKEEKKTEDYRIPSKSIQPPAKDQKGISRWKYDGNDVEVTDLPSRSKMPISEEAYQAWLNMVIKTSSYPHILYYYGYLVSQVSDPTYSFVSEIIPSASLYDRLHDQKNLPLGQRYDFALDVARALAHIHKHSIAHGDLKSRNVRLSSGECAKLSGFRLTEKTAPAHDISQLGIILWEIWTRDDPDPKQIHNSISAVLKPAESSSSEKVLNGFPKSYVALIASCFNQDYSQRPTAEAVVRQLESKSMSEKFKPAVAAPSAS